MELDKVDRVLILDLKGPMAHFRAFYTNSSSLSYSFPPRTVVTGLLAGIIGLPRDSYYYGFSGEHCKVAVSILSPFRKIMNTINYSYLKSTKDLVFRDQHFQVQFETVIPFGDGHQWGELKYRIYIWHSDKRILDEISIRTREKRYKYPPFMGISEYIAEMELINDISKDDFQVIQSDNYEDFCTVLNADLISENGLQFSNGSQPLQYLKETMPLEFKEDRSNKSTAKFIFEKNLRKVRAKISCPFIRIGGENVIFMERHNVTN